MEITLKELLPRVLKLDAIDKIRLLRILAEEIETLGTMDKGLLSPNKVYYNHTPTFEPGAAEQLLKLLEQDGVKAQ